MSVELVTMCVDIGRRWRHTNAIDFSFYRSNLDILVNLGLPIHVFAGKDTLKSIIGHPNVKPHQFGVEDIKAQSWSAAASRLWASDDWQNRFAWMKSSNAPELLCEYYCQLTSMKPDALAETAAISDPNKLLVFVDCHDSAMHYRAGNFDAFEAHVTDRIALHWTPYTWTDNEELHGMRWPTLEPLSCPKEARPPMHLMAGIMVGRAKTFTDFFPHYKATREALFATDLGTEQSILTAIYFRDPDKWLMPVKYPDLFKALSA